MVRVGNLDSARDIMDVRDTVRAYVALMEKGSSGEVYNVASGEAYTIRELLAVLQLFGKDQRICSHYEIKEGPKLFETEIRGKKFAMHNDTIIGYAKDGTKIIETTVEEPVHIRPDKHANSI